MAKVRVGVIRGGMSPEYDLSLSTGSAVLGSLGSKYKPLDVLITKDGQWHVWGEQVNPVDLAHRCDVIFNALHGYYGEDGKIQKVLDHIGIPYTGSGALGSALSSNKYLARDILKKYDIKAPLFKKITRGRGSEGAFTVFNTLSPPWVIKLGNTGDSSRFAIAKSYPELEGGILRALDVDPLVYVEEYIGGDEAKCFVIQGVGNMGYYALPLGAYNEREVGTVSKIAHRALGLGHYSRVDIIRHPTRGIFVVNVKAQPALASDSLFAKTLKKAEISMSEFFDHVLSLARGKK